MSRLRTLLLFAALAGLATVFAACGGSDSGSSDESPEAVLKGSTFEGIESADLDLSVNVDVSGEEPGSVDIRGSRIIVALTAESVGFSTSWIERSTNNGRSWSEVSGSARSNGRMVGAVAAPGGVTRVVEAWDQSISFPENQRVRFRRQR